MRDLLVAVLFGGAIPLALFRPWLGILAFTMFGFLNPHKLTWALQDFPFAMGLAIATLIGLVGTTQKRALPFTRELVLLLVLFLHFTVTTVLAWEPAAAWETWDKLARVLLMIVVAGFVIFGEKKIRWYLLMPMIGIGFFGIKGGIFSLMTGGQHQIIGPEGTFIVGNTSLGLAMNMVLPLMVFKARELSVRWHKLVWYGCSMLMMVAIIFTYSRGAWLGLAAAFPLMFARSKGQVIAMLLLLPVLLLGKELLPEKVGQRATTIKEYEQDSSAMQRLQSWSVATNVALERPLIGAGFQFDSTTNWGRWLSYADRKYDDVKFVGPQTAHSIYFQVLGHHGFVGLALFVTLLVCAFLSFGDIKRKAARTPQLKWLSYYAAALQVGMVSYAVSGAFLSLAYFDLLYFFVICIPIFRREIATVESLEREQSRGTQGKRRSGLPFAQA